MATSPRMRWPFPNEGADPWYDSFAAMVDASDASAFAAFETQGIFISGGGDFTFNASTDSLSWDADAQINNAVVGVPQFFDAGAVTLQDGQFAYVNLVRGAPPEAPFVTIKVASSLPNTGYDSVLFLWLRVGARVFFRNGAVLQDGDTAAIFDEGGGGGGGSGTVTSVTAGIGLSGGVITTAGTIDVVYGSSPNTACEGDDARLSYYPQRPTAWGNEYLWWRLDDAAQSSGLPNVAANSGSAGAASLTATTNPTSGNSNGGALYDKSPMFGVPSLFGAIARFRGSYNTLQGAASVYPATTAFTMTAWVNINESGGAFTCNVVTKKHPSGYSVGLLTSGGRVYYLIRTASGEVTYYTASNLLTYGLPNFLALTYDGTTIRGYLNGQEVVSGAQSGAIVWATGAGSEWEIGQISGGIERYDIWEVRVAPSVRSAAQLLADYKTGAGLGW